MKKLADEKPENFDKAWVDKMVDKHQATINKLENGRRISRIQI
jgi:predicted outer membrane protein